MSFDIEKKVIRHLFQLLSFVLITLTFMPQLLVAIGAVASVCMLVSALFIVPVFFIWTISTGKDYKDRD
ncbi:hypothetical protein [Aneurinibacillus tyrosinisolvens]|uniref:hypothetical protein n=1 Tax=Aneurinibacillus tyrosinisolvens TaxID=1443435 RepID=UPI00063EE5C3|nr:hypothetical protein [Aneurinibacillus tyrosinisolvens]